MAPGASVTMLLVGTSARRSPRGKRAAQSSSWNGGGPPFRLAKARGGALATFMKCCSNCCSPCAQENEALVVRSLDEREAT